MRLLDLLISCRLEPKCISIGSPVLGIHLIAHKHLGVYPRSNPCQQGCQKFTSS